MSMILYIDKILYIDMILYVNMWNITNIQCPNDPGL
jgi:hypothetical protein